MSPMHRKTALSLFMVTLFSMSAVYERIHGDSADLLTLVMNDIASRGNSEVLSAEEHVVAETQPHASSSEEYAQYLAKLNAEAAKASARKVTAPAPAPVISKRRHRDEEDDDEDFTPQIQESRSINTQIQTASTQAPAPITPTPSTPVSAPEPVPQPVTPPVTQVNTPKGQYKDGTYTGPSVNVFYGFVQIQAVVAGGKLTDVSFLSYPNDRNTSRRINQEAMPILIQEAITAQNAQVDGVSGASDTSQGFIESLTSALSQAAS